MHARLWWDRRVHGHRVAGMPHPGPTPSSISHQLCDLEQTTQPLSARLHREAWGRHFFQSPPCKSTAAIKSKGSWQSRAPEAAGGRAGPCLLRPRQKLLPVPLGSAAPFWRTKGPNNDFKNPRGAELPVAGPFESTIPPSQFCFRVLSKPHCSFLLPHEWWPQTHHDVGSISSPVKRHFISCPPFPWASSWQRQGELDRVSQTKKRGTWRRRSLDCKTRSSLWSI